MCLFPKTFLDDITLAYFSEKIGRWLVLNKSLHNLCYPQVMNENFKGFNFPTFFSLHMQGKEHFLSSSLYFMRKRDKSNPNINCGAAAGDPFFLKAAVRQLHFLTQNRLSIYVKAITMQYIAKKNLPPKTPLRRDRPTHFQEKKRNIKESFFCYKY